MDYKTYFENCFVINKNRIISGAMDKTAPEHFVKRNWHI